MADKFIHYCYDANTDNSSGAFRLNPREGAYEQGREEHKSEVQEGKADVVEGEAEVQEGEAEVQ